MKKLLAVFLSVTVSAAPMISSAATVPVPAPTDLKTAKQWAAIMGPKPLAAAASDCIASVKSGAGTTSVTLVNGTRFETVASADGKGKKLLTFDATGKLLQSADVPAEKSADKGGVPNYVAREENYQAMKRFSKDAFLAAVRNQCRAMAVKRPAPPVSNEAQDVGNGGDVAKASDADADFDYFADFDGAPDLFSDMADELMNDDTATADREMSGAADTQTTQKCAVVISQCRESCASWGAWFIGSCVAIGAALNKKLPVGGVIFGIECTGDATAWMEHCKRECNTPTVKCEQ